MIEKLHANTATYPREINKNVEKLLTLLDTDYEPEYLQVVPEKGAEIGWCYQNVEAKIKRDGGQSHYGWQSGNLTTCVKQSTTQFGKAIMAT